MKAKSKKRTSRRKGKVRPPTIGKDCKYLRYECGQAVCSRKEKVNEYRDDVKCGGVPAFDDVSCSKSKYCWYEPAECATVERLNRITRKDQSK